jgi:phage terminase small subunit
MPVLRNPKHERFAQETASGKGPSEAYRLAGFVSKSVKGTSVNASRLLAQTSIQDRVKELLTEREAIHAQATAEAIKSTALTKQWVIERLVQNVERAMQEEEIRNKDGGTGEYRYEGSVANRALELLGKELGMFVDRREVGKPGEFEDMDANELRNFVRREAAALGVSVSDLEGEGRGGKPQSKSH